MFISSSCSSESVRESLQERVVLVVDNVKPIVHLEIYRIDNKEPLPWVWKAIVPVVNRVVIRHGC